MMKYLFVFALVVICHTEMSAQSDFLKGFIQGVTNGVQKKKTESQNTSTHKMTNSHSSNQYYDLFKNGFDFYYKSVNDEPIHIRGVIGKDYSIGQINVATGTVNTNETEYMCLTYYAIAFETCRYIGEQGNYLYFFKEDNFSKHHVYLKKDFSEVKVNIEGSFPSKRQFGYRINKAEYDKLKSIQDRNLKEPEGGMVNPSPSNPNSSSTNSKTNSGKGKCKYCNNGICPRCKGSGHVKSPDLSRIIDCGACSGSGKCKICYGRGYYYY